MEPRLGYGYEPYGGGAGRGKCLLMCPDSERTRREVERKISVFEMDCSLFQRHQSTPALAVKEYVRAGAGHTLPNPSDLRPPSVLKKTINYLMTCIVDRTDYPWHVVYEFISNRIQAIRLDITFQQCELSEVMDIYEVATRFYLYAQYRLWDSSLEQFDPKMNGDQLQQCLVKVVRQGKQVLEAKHVVRDTTRVGRGIKLGEKTVSKPVGRGSRKVQEAAPQGPGPVGRGRKPGAGRGVTFTRQTVSGKCDASKLPEFLSYYLLLNMGVTDAIHYVLELPRAIRQHPSVSLALEINLSFLRNNFVRVFRLIRQLSPLGRSAVLAHIARIRRLALQALCSAYSSSNALFPLRLFSQWLLFDSLDHAATLCRDHGVEVLGEDILFRRGAFKIPEEETISVFNIPELLATTEKNSKSTALSLSPSHFILQC